MPAGDRGDDRQRNSDVLLGVNDLVYTLAGSELPRRAPAAASAPPAPAASSGPRAQNPGTVPRVERTPLPESIDAVWSRAETQLPTWTTLTMRLPEEAGAPVAFTITDGSHWNAFARSQLSLSAADGAVVQWQPYERSSLGQKVRGWLRFAHTGELGGLPGQLVAGIGCLGGVMLVYTGWSLAWRRFWAWSRRLGRRDALDWEAANP